MTDTPQMPARFLPPMPRKLAVPAKEATARTSPFAVASPEEVSATLAHLEGTPLAPRTQPLLPSPPAPLAPPVAPATSIAATSASIPLPTPRPAPAEPETEELEEEPLSPEEEARAQQKRQIKQAKRSNMFLFGSNREIRRLPLYLNPDEEVLLIASGSRKDQRGRGLIVATDRRVLFIWDGWVFRTEQDFRYETISSVEFNTGILFGVFTVYGLGDEVSYNWVDRFVGHKMTRLVRQKVMAAKSEWQNGAYQDD